MTPGAELKLGVRPEHLRVGGSEGLRVTATVELIERLGEISYAHTRSSDGQPVIAELSGREAPAIGDNAVFGADPRDMHVFDAQGRRISPAA